MTVLMTFIGTFVFMFSCFTIGFAGAWRRLFVFALTGLLIDCFIIGTAVLVHYATTL